MNQSHYQCFKVKVLNFKDLTEEEQTDAIEDAFVGSKIACVLLEDQPYIVIKVNWNLGILDKVSSNEDVFNRILEQYHSLKEE